MCPFELETHVVVITRFYGNRFNLRFKNHTYIFVVMSNGNDKIFVHAHLDAFWCAVSRSLVLELHYLDHTGVLPAAARPLFGQCRKACQDISVEG